MSNWPSLPRARGFLESPVGLGEAGRDKTWLVLVGSVQTQSSGQDSQRSPNWAGEWGEGRFWQPQRVSGLVSAGFRRGSPSLSPRRALWPLGAFAFYLRNEVEGEPARRVSRGVSRVSGGTV